MSILDGKSRGLFFYSGGKDSLAVLLLLKDLWQSDRLEVVWVNTHCNFPEVQEHMDRVKGLVKHFTELRSDVAAWQKEHGHPVDLVPTSNDMTGQFIYGGKGQTYCSRWDCCGRNLWAPMSAYIAEKKPDVIIRGDRSSERVEQAKSAEGSVLELPIFGWTTEQVQGFIKKEGKPLGLYQQRHALSEGSSLDCMTCTAYNIEHKERMSYMEVYHPQLHKSMHEFFSRYRKDIYSDLKEIL